MTRPLAGGCDGRRSRFTLPLAQIEPPEDNDHQGDHDKRRRTPAVDAELELLALAGEDEPVALPTGGAWDRTEPAALPWRGT